MTKIQLPRKNDKGKYRISYSQLNTFIGEEAFNKILDTDGKLKNISGSTGYILNYFMGYVFPKSPMDIYAPFGQKCEAYIAEGIKDDLSEPERKMLDKIPTLSNFQELVEIDFGDFVIEGFIDNCNADRSHIVDFKTASVASSKKYEKQDYYQLDIYAMDYYKKFGRIPEKMEVIVIERGGSHFKPPLMVKGSFVIPKSTSIEKMEYVENDVILPTVQKISDCFKLFKKVQKL